MEARKTTIALISTGIAEPLLMMGHTGFPGILAGLAIGAGVYYLMDDEKTVVGGQPSTTPVPSMKARSGSTRSGSKALRRLLYGKQHDDWQMPTDEDVEKELQR